MSLFKTGQVVCTMGIREMIIGNPEAADTIQKCLNRHMDGD